MKSDLLSARLRLAIREELVGWPLGAIGDLFRAEGFDADLTHNPQVTGERRCYVEQFYVAIDWADWDQVRCILRIGEAVLDRMRLREPPESDGSAIAESRESFETLFRRDGFEFDEHNAIRPRWEVLTQDVIRRLSDESAVPGHLRRMWDAVEARPEQSISAAKDALESAAKHVLAALGIELTGREKFPSIVDSVQRELRLHPKTVAPDAKGAEALMAILGSLATIAHKIDEFRNLYGDGHGRSTKTAGFARHQAALAFGDVVCSGQTCQKHPSTMTATRAGPKEMSAVRRSPGTGRTLTRNRSPRRCNSDRILCSTTVPVLRCRLI